MTETLASFDFLTLGVLPYVALAMFAWGTIERLREHPYSVSSGSSQFLENRRHFWSVVPFHYGVIVVLAGHALALALPQTILRWNAAPLRLYALEATGFTFGLLALFGFAAVILRRATVGAVRITTKRLDWVVYALLLLQLASGVSVAVLHPWGSSWFAALVAPYLWSLLTLRPDLAMVAVLPLDVKLHIVGAFVLIGAFPFSRLVHVINVPNGYFWRRPQVVRWYRPLPRRVEE